MENFERSLKYVQENQGKHGVVLGINALSDLVKQILRFLKI